MHTTIDLIKLALSEDIGPGDITTGPLVDPLLAGTGYIVAKEPIILAGLETAIQVFKFLDPEASVQAAYKDGDFIKKGQTLLNVKGSLFAMLTAERTALNFLQRLSGIATHVNSYIKELGDTKRVRLVDTRKTTPGWRVLEKYAVRVGGAKNHRMGLYDGVLIKDNHIAVSGGVEQAIQKVRKSVSHLVKIEVEVTDQNGVKEALRAGAEIIMLDNMSLDQIRAAKKIIGKKAMVEVSGGITRDNLSALADCGVDIISVGALTHSARCVDLSMKIIRDA